MYTALILAAESGFVEVLKVLLQFPGEIDITNTVNGSILA